MLCMYVCVCTVSVYMYMYVFSIFSYCNFAFVFKLIAWPITMCDCHRGIKDVLIDGFDDGCRLFQVFRFEYSRNIE